EQEYTRLLNELLTEGMDVLLRLIASESDGAGIRSRPLEQFSVVREKRGELPKIVENNLQIAIDELLTMAESQSGQEFAGSTGTDSGVVLERDDLLQKRAVAAGQPSQAQAGQAVGLADRTEAESAFIEIARGRQTGAGIVLEFAVNLV